jgi:hypothetical protein
MNPVPYTRAEEVAHQLEIWFNTHDMEKHALVREAVALLRAPPTNEELLALVEDRIAKLGREAARYRYIRAARYRYIRANSSTAPIMEPNLRGDEAGYERLDAAIDAAIKLEGKP